MKYQEQIEQYIESKREEMKAAIGRLVAIPGVLEDAQEGAPFGKEIARALEEALQIAKEWGLSATNYDGYVGAVDVNHQETNLHILCHLDIVAPGEGWETDPYQMIEKDGMLFGRGVDDDKGPAIASMLALRAIKDLGIALKKNVRLLLGTDEETGSRDIRYYYEREPYAEYSFSPDSAFPITNIEKGYYGPELSAAWEVESVSPRVTSFQGGIRINVVPPKAQAVVCGLQAGEIACHCEKMAQETGAQFTIDALEDGICIHAIGKNAHAAAPENGINAITALLALLSELPLADCASTRALRGFHALFPHGDFQGKSLGIAMQDEESGSLTLTLSLLFLKDNKLQARFDSRLPICATEENCRLICESACKEQGLQCEGEMGPAHYVPEDSFFIKTLLACYENYTEKKGYCIADGGGTYVHNIPGGVAFGAGRPEFDSCLHGANERVEIDSLLTAAKIYAQSIVELCGEFT